jgi:hypothetical protein
MSAHDPNGILILLHQVHATISLADALAALPEEQRSWPREVCAFDSFRAELRASQSIDWHAAEQALLKQLEEVLRPMQKLHPTWRIAYFGAAPIPLAMRLGQLVGDWERVDIYQRHHVRGDWSWAPVAERPAKEAKVKEAPKERNGAAGAAIVCVSTANAISTDDARAVVTSPFEPIEIALDPTGPDVLETAADLDAVADSFVQTLDHVADLRRGVDAAHVFAAVPVGLAFRMGQRINPTKHPDVQTYQYQRGVTPVYREALRLRRQVETTAELSEADRAAAGAMRAVAAQELTALREFGDVLKEWIDAASTSDWPAAALGSKAGYEPFKVRPWAALPVLTSASSLLQSTVAADAEGVAEFEFDPGVRVWRFGDGLMATLARRFTDEGARRRSLRMLLLHEGVHLASHKLTSSVSQEIGRFPKILEELDYQADVWTMLHEYGFTRKKARASTDDARAFFRDLVDTALETYWAFDDGPQPLAEMQVRRLNRYLIWYWQRLRIEAANSLPEVLAVLAERPYLELAGPDIFTRAGRVFYRLDRAPAELPELAILTGSAVRRLGTGPSLPLPMLLAAFRNRQGPVILTLLRGAFDQR